MKSNNRFHFQNLRVWSKSVEVVKLVYQMSTHFPSSEKYGLVSQMRRASVSILSNIAEGNSRFKSKDRARFFEVAFSSTVELQAQIVLCFELKFIQEVDFQKLVNMTQEITKMLNGLHKHQLKNQSA
jgi:four helix bundle protein